MGLKEHFDLHQEAAKHVNPWKFAGWFCGLTIPFAVASSFFFQWQNGQAQQIGPVQLLVRGLVLLTGFFAILTFLNLKFLRPALKKARMEMGQRSTFRKTED